MTHRVGGSSARPWLHGSLVCLLAFFGLTAAVTRAHLEEVDQRARALVQGAQAPALRSFMEAASTLGGQPGQVPIVLLGSALLWARRRRWALVLPAAMAGVGLVQLLAKWAVDRPRPNLAPWGFPSAHVFSLVVLCGLLAFIVCAETSCRVRRRCAVAAGAGVVVIVAYSRMYLDAHWLTDVAGGLTAGLAYLGLVIAIACGAPRLGRSRGTALASGTSAAEVG